MNANIFPNHVREGGEDPLKPRNEFDFIDEKLLQPVFQSALEEIDLPLSGEAIRAFTCYGSLLKEWNEKMNLTAITDENGIALKHFIDSLTLVSHIEKEKRNERLTLIDVGTGAGFPGLPLKVAMPDLKVTLVDSLQKRVRFLKTVAESLELKDMKIIHGRAEELGRAKIYREKYDIATARAVASLPVLAEYLLPFVRVGGIVLAMKGDIDLEAESARKAIVTLGGSLEEIQHFILPGTELKRSIVKIRKIRPTPGKYPRKSGTPYKEPIL